jgi:pimeloyl-ACP methyl ester carboxylesterase
MKPYTLILIAGMLITGCGGKDDLRTFELQNGQFAGAKYRIAAPGKWNRHVVLLAHGMRPTANPLSAAFPVDSPFYQGLLDEGWIVASSSYRRNGMIVGEAGQDLTALREHIALTYGTPARVFLIGWSMGGAVATMIAESDGRSYAGVLAIGADLECRDQKDPYELTHSPLIPILFLSNRNVASGPRDYIARSADAKEIPILWTIDRDGRCNISDAELAAAFNALRKYAATGMIAPDKDATIPLDMRKSTARFEHGGIYTKIAGISDEFGNLYTEIIEADLITRRIEPESYFSLHFKDTPFKVYYGATYSDVPRGQWVALLTREGNLKIARNLENAAETLGAREGDTLFIEKCPEQGAP